MQPPSAPGTLTGSAPTATEVDLSWGAATDNVGVTGYQIWRCQGARLHELRAGRAGRHGHDLLRSRRLGKHELQLRGPRARRRRQPRPVLEHVHRDDAYEHGHAAAVGARHPDRLERRRDRDRPQLGRRERQRRRHRLSHRPLPGAGLHRLLAPRPADRDSDHLQGHGRLQPNTSYSYQVRAMDAAGNLGPVSNTATAVHRGRRRPRRGVLVRRGVGHDRHRTRSGNGNNGTLVNATWSAAGKYGGALSFNGSNARGRTSRARPRCS